MNPKGGEAETTTFVGALRITGVTAPIGLDGPMNGAWFLSDVERVLAPTLIPPECANAFAAAGYDAG